MSDAPSTTSAKKKAEEFLAISSQFKLGDLPTEQSHPRTKDLSRLAREDVAAALNLFKEVEIQAYSSIADRLPEIETLSTALRAVLQEGGNVYLVGCGATGRLSLAIETLWRKLTRGTALENRVFSFMAGGDYALVKSIENFEDHPEFGEKQLLEAGFRAGDILIACTEGGETPFVIGAAERAAREVPQNAQARRPWFLYCNPDDVLARVAERSKHVLENENIRKLNLNVGPMAITGSTRLQATSVLMFAAGSALLHAADLISSPSVEHAQLLEAMRAFDLDRFAAIVKREGEIYAAGNRCVHVSRDHAISVLTDLTERSPTFSLPPFENFLNGEQDIAWTYLEIPGSSNSVEAWNTVLERPVRTLAWPEFMARYDQRVVHGFDFSGDVAARRSTWLKDKTQFRYRFEVEGTRLRLTLDDIEARTPRGKSLLSEHLLLKLALNASSTLVMGRLGRFEGNVMLWVKSSNNKLIDRSIRYIRNLIENDGFQVSYDETAYALFETLENLGPNQAAVLQTRDHLRNSLRK